MEDEKYWKDYTEFISEVEKLTELSPADLISQYLEVLDEFNDAHEDYFLEWQYEFDKAFWIRKKVQMVIDHKPISGNILLKNFIDQILIIDREIKNFVPSKDQSEWWNNHKLRFKRN